LYEFLPSAAVAGRSPFSYFVPVRFGQFRIFSFFRCRRWPNLILPVHDSGSEKSPGHNPPLKTTGPVATVVGLLLFDSAVRRFSVFASEKLHCSRRKVRVRADMADNTERRPVVGAVCEDFEKGCSVSAKVDFVDGFENPVSWHKRYNSRSDQSDVLFDNLDMKSITLSQYGVEIDRLPEFIKWKL